MDIQTCLLLLELPQDASPEQVRRAYKDLVAIWHPDRFATNPRLRQRAEAKVKEINRAYETLEAFFSSEGASGGRPETGRQQEHPKVGSSGNVEAFAELGTRIFLDLCSRLHSAIQRLTDSETSHKPPGAGGPNKGKDNITR